PRDLLGRLRRIVPGDWVPAGRGDRWHPRCPVFGSRNVPADGFYGSDAQQQRVTRIDELELGGGELLGRHVHLVGDAREEVAVDLEFEVAFREARAPEQVLDLEHRELPEDEE